MRFNAIRKQQEISILKSALIYGKKDNHMFSTFAEIFLNHSIYLRLYSLFWYPTEYPCYFWEDDPQTKTFTTTDAFLELQKNENSLQFRFLRLFRRLCSSSVVLFLIIYTGIVSFNFAFGRIILLQITLQPLRHTRIVDRP